MASGNFFSEDDSSGSSSNRINSTPLKKQSVIDETLVDLISQLPESLLIQILSLLPTKDAFSTSILSKRWISLCTFVHSFYFSRSDFVKTENSVRSSSVEYVLAHSVSSKINKLELDLAECYELDHSQINYLKSLIGPCLNFAVERNVENVVICFYGSGCFPLPQSFCTCSSLITLVVSCVSIQFDGVIEWKSLKTLKLERLRLLDEDIFNLLSGCPALESFELSNVRGFHRLEINSSNLKRLNLTRHSMSWMRDDKPLEIFAPYIKHLEISEDPYDRKCRLLDVSSVVNAKLTFDVTCIKDILALTDEVFFGISDIDEDSDDEEDSCHDYHQAFGTLVQDYLQKLSNATQLTIGTWFTDALCMLQLKGESIQELKCKYLTLELHLQKFSLYGAAGLLQASPHVETLSIDSWSSYKSPSRCRFGLIYLAKGDDIDLQSCFVFPKLKKVQIVISFKDCVTDNLKWGFDKLSKLCEFLLKTATVLEEFVIISKRENRSRFSMNYVPMSLFRNLAKKLLSCQRSSAKSTIIFNDEL